MTTYTIDAENGITAFPTPEHAEAAVGAGAQAFTNQEELAELAAAWPSERLVAIWNSLPGVTPVERFKDRKSAVTRIWKSIQGLGEPEKPQAEQPEKPKAGRKAKGGAHAAKGAPAKPKATKKATTAKKAPKTKKGAKPREAGPREGSKTAQVVAMLQRKNGATLDELASTFQWERHTVRGMIAGSLKKATPVKKAPKAKKAAKTRETGPREGSKTAQVIAMLQRKNGATLSEIMEKMGWQKHTVRGFMAGAMKKAGFTVESFKSDKGDRTYRINQ